MKTILVALSAIGLAAPAYACEFHSAGAHDTMTTASIQAPMSTREDASESAADSKEMTGGVIADGVREEKAE